VAASTEGATKMRTNATITEIGGIEIETGVGIIEIGIGTVTGIEVAAVPTHKARHPSWVDNRRQMEYSKHPQLIRLSMLPKFRITVRPERKAKICLQVPQHPLLGTFLLRFIKNSKHFPNSLLQQAASK